MIVVPLRGMTVPVVVMGVLLLVTSDTLSFLQERPIVAHTKSAATKKLRRTFITVIFEQRGKDLFYRSMVTTFVAAGSTGMLGVAITTDCFDTP
jgi:hypothetical protein